MRKSFKVFLLAIILLAGSAFIHGAKAEAAGSYMIKVNKQQNVVTVYKYKDGKYKAFKAFPCSAGSATPTGSFSLKEKMRWHELDGPSYGQYCSRITGHILFHSVWYYQQTNDSQSYVQYNKLGTTASHGCIRLTVGDAKWIYDNAPSGTKVVVYNSAKPGPLGKPSAIKVSGYSGWDPTDPDPANPYANKKPSIKGVKNKSIEYGSKFNPKKGVTVKNTTGFNAKKLLKIDYLYKMDSKSPYVKVKKIDTKKPGRYRAIYRITDEIGRKAKETAIYKVLSSVEVSSITLDSKSKTLYLGGAKSKQQFTLKVKKIKPAKATTKKVVYYSSDTSVATVTKKGVVKAKKAGTAVITVKAADGSGTTATCKVKVRQYVTKLKITAPGHTLDVGNAMQLRVTVTPSDVTNKKVKYTSSDSSIATVDENGIVRALKPGTVTISAKAADGSGKTAKCKITVSYYFDQIVAETHEPVTVASGSPWTVVEQQLPEKVTVQDRFGNEASASVTWDGSNYDETTPGTYEALGQVVLPNGWSGTVPSMKVQIIVEAAQTASGTEENQEEKEDDE